MMNNGKTLALVSTALTALLLSACSASPKILALSDREAAPAAYPLVRLQEAPAFPVDERKKPFAAMADREERAPGGDKSSSLEESKPNK